MTTTAIKSICIRDHEARALIRNGRVTLVRVMKLSDEYTRGCDPGLALLAGNHAAHLRDGIGLVWWSYASSSDVPIPPDRIAEYSPFGAVGTRLVCKEAYARRDDFDWRADREKTLHYLRYKASCEGDLGDEWHYYDKWRPASTMASWMSRLTIETAAVSVKRCHDMTRDEAMTTSVERVNPYDVTPDLPPGMPACWINYETGGWYAGAPIASLRSMLKKQHGPDIWRQNAWLWLGDVRRVDQ